MPRVVLPHFPSPWWLSRCSPELSYALFPLSDPAQQQLRSPLPCPGSIPSVFTSPPFAARLHVSPAILFSLQTRPLVSLFVLLSPLTSLPLCPFTVLHTSDHISSKAAQDRKSATVSLHNAAAGCETMAPVQRQFKAPPKEHTVAWFLSSAKAPLEGPVREALFAGLITS